MPAFSPHTLKCPYKRLEITTLVISLNHNTTNSLAQQNAGKKHSRRGGVYVTDSAHTLGGHRFAAGMGRMSETSAESVILAHRSRRNNVSGKKKDSFPVTLQVFFHELSSSTQTSTLMSLQRDTFGGMLEKTKKKKKSQCKRERWSVLTSYSAAFNGDHFKLVDVCKTLFLKNN